MATGGAEDESPTHNLPSGRQAVVTGEEPLARFAISKSQFTKTTRRPKPNLLSPNPHLALSVMRIEGSCEEEIRKMGSEVGEKRRKNCYGYTTLTGQKCSEERLEVESDEPPLHHANITGWPDDTDPAERKRRQLEIAKRLVEKATPMAFFLKSTRGDPWTGTPVGMLQSKIRYHIIRLLIERSKPFAPF